MTSLFIQISKINCCPQFFWGGNQSIANLERLLYYLTPGIYKITFESEITGFVFTVANPHADDLHIKVIDSGHKNAVIGTTTIRTSNIMAAVDMEYRLQSFDLKRSGPVQSGIKLAANVRILQNSRPKKISDALAAQSSLDRGQQDQGSAKKASAAGQPEVMKKQKSPTPDPKVPIQEVASEVIEYCTHEIIKTVDL